MKRNSPWKAILCAILVSSAWLAPSTTRSANAQADGLRVGALHKVSVDRAGNNVFDRSYNGGISGNGRYVAFSTVNGESTANELGFGVVRKDILSGEVQVVPGADDPEIVPNTFGVIGISGDGNKIVFSARSCVVDYCKSTKYFVADIADGRVDTLPLAQGVNSLFYNQNRDYARFSSDGQSIAYLRSSGQAHDVYVYNLQTQQEVMASVDLYGRPCSVLYPYSFYNGVTCVKVAGISANGRYVSYNANSNGGTTAIVRDVLTQKTITVTNELGLFYDYNYASSDASMNETGSEIVFASKIANFGAAGDANRQQIYTRSLAVGARVTDVHMLSVSSSGVPGNSYSYEPEISADGKCIVYTSTATNIVAQDTTSESDVYLKCQGQETVWISQGISRPFSTCSSSRPHISADNMRVVFDVQCAVDTGYLVDSSVYVADLLQGSATATPSPQPTSTPTQTPTATPQQASTTYIANIHGYQGFLGKNMVCPASSTSSGLVRYNPSNPAMVAHAGNVDMVRELHAMGHPVFLPSYTSGSEHTGAIRDNALCIAPQIQDILDMMRPADKLVLLCHSLGCPVTRYYLEQLKGEGAVDDRIDWLIMMGGPNGGLPSNLPSVCPVLAKLLKTLRQGDIGNGCNFAVQTGINELLPQNMTWLKNSQPVSSIKYAAIGGNSHDPLARVARRVFGGIIRLGPEYSTDFLVGAKSALSVLGIINVFVTGENHSAADAKLAPIGYQAITGTQVITVTDSTKIVENLITGAPYTVDTLAAYVKAQSILQHGETVAMQPQYSEGNLIAASSFARQAQNTIMSIEVGTDGQSIAVIEGSSSERTITVRNPLGVVVEPGLTGSELEVVSGDASSIVFISSTVTGTWSIDITPLNGFTGNLFTASVFESDEKAELSLPVSARLGSRVQVSVVYSGVLGTSIANASVAFTVQYPDGNVASLNGSNISFAAAQTGTHQVEADISWLGANGNRQKRTLRGVIEVGPGDGVQTSTPTPTLAPSVTTAPTASSTMQATQTSVASPTTSVTPSATNTPHPSVTATSEPTATPTATPTLIPSVTATSTVRATSTPVPRTLVYLPMLNR